MTLSFAVLLLALTVAAADKAQLADINKYSFIVAIISRGEVVCNGGILSQHWIVTTAHCLLHIDYNSTEIHCGQHVYKYRRHAIFPFYHKDHLLDLGLLRIQAHFQFRTTLRPGQLAAEPFPKSQIICHSVGWQRDSSGQLNLWTFLYEPILKRGCYKQKGFPRQYLICTENVTLAPDEKRCDSNSSRLLVCRGIIAGILIGEFNKGSNRAHPCGQDFKENGTFEANLLLGYFHWYIQTYVYDIITPTPLYDIGYTLRGNFTLLALALALASIFTV